MIFLDTDVLIDLLREYPPAIAWVASHGEDEFAVAGFVVMELVQGCRNRMEQQAVESLVERYGVVWPSSVTCNEALAVFNQFHLSHGLGILDALIAQTAVSLNAPLHTFNEKHYSYVPNLRTLQPYDRETEG